MDVGGGRLKADYWVGACLVLRPLALFFISSIRFGSCGPSENARPRQISKIETNVSIFSGAKFHVGRFAPWPKNRKKW